MRPVNWKPESSETDKIDAADFLAFSRAARRDCTRNKFTNYADTPTMDWLPNYVIIFFVNHPKIKGPPANLLRGCHKASSSLSWSPFRIVWWATNYKFKKFPFTHEIRFDACRAEANQTNWKGPSFEALAGHYLSLGTQRRPPAGKQHQLLQEPSELSESWHHGPCLAARRDKARGEEKPNTNHTIRRKTIFNFHSHQAFNRSLRDAVADESNTV